MFSTRIRSFEWRDILRSFKSSPEKHDKEENGEPAEVEPMFDRARYKIIIKFPFPANYTEMLDWVNKNTNGSVKIETSIVPVGDISAPWYSPAGLQRPQSVYMGFENPDDATFFKIKYAV